MSAIVEAPVDYPVALQEYIPQLFEATTAQRQWDTLDRLEWQPATDPAIQNQLFDFAADPSMAPALVRMRALDFGIRGLEHSVRQAQEGGALLTAQQQANYDHLRRLAPDYFETDKSAVMRSCDFATYRGKDPYWLAGRMLCWTLADQAGLRPSHTYAREAQDGQDADFHTYDVPTAPILMLDSLIGLSDESASKFLPPSLYPELVELALDFRSGALEQAIADPTSYPVAAFARLGRLTKEGGYEHDGPIEYLYQHRANQEVMRLVHELNRLYDSAPLLGTLYPDIDQELLSSGVRSLVANALFAMQHYALHAGIDTTVSFPGGEPIAVQEANPIEVVQATIAAIQTAHQQLTDPDVFPVFGVGESGFHHCLFVNARTGQSSQLSYHGRAERTETYNPDYEFAGDATSRYRVQLDTTRHIAFRNADQLPRTVSLRFDFDRFGFALDVGALRSNPHTETNDQDDLEVRVGRFFALGNYLRSQAVDARPTMNHVHVPGVEEACFSAIIHAQERRLREQAASLFTSTAYPDLVGAH